MEYKTSNKIGYGNSSQLGYQNVCSVGADYELKYKLNSSGNGNYSSNMPEMLKGSDLLKF